MRRSLTWQTLAFFQTSLFIVALSLIVFLLYSFHHSSVTLTDASQMLPQFSKTNPSPIYSAEPGDSWNRIFNLLFTRNLKVRFSKDFPQSGPFIGLTGPLIAHAEPEYVSSRVYEQHEEGDRAIDPLYPSFFSAGPLQILAEPQYSEFLQALTEALNEPQVKRVPTARALMQSDLWAAYDLLYRERETHETSEFRTRKDRVLSLLAQLIRRIAMSRPEIGQLPQNCIAAGEHHQLPKFFDPASGWLEIEFKRQRLHDFSVNFRRDARVFVKPIAAPPDPIAFLESLRMFTFAGTPGENFPANLEAVALVEENLLIDSQGEIVASPLIQDVQIRRFIRNGKGEFIRGEFREFELSRRKLLTDLSGSGFNEFDESAPVFKSAAGNDYGFATPYPLGDPPNPPLVVKLESRCADCHGVKGTFLMSFSTHEFGSEHGNRDPALRVLDVKDDSHGQIVIGRKLTSADFMSLLKKADWKKRVVVDQK